MPPGVETSYTSWSLVTGRGVPSRSTPWTTPSRTTKVLSRSYAAIVGASSRNSVERWLKRDTILSHWSSVRDPRSGRVGRK
ncbi:hypothetical protein GCM10010358_45150 [Streptomyces minutiscleroticus]|uniref:Uncharacterized protein n=1 Tax=Streptomyces minutiscleroticus TaxID=68238 RepID=A0A918U383_9ACTN|nr:hypothetical protein GCM10010358_45150 [Streptomyces minutiscleroticus]